jgi:alkanesulfonate monooxygenase SsuD/methylene tetrahydromethanopterin reductase-like flavin-dependent oxidoreductase (luciferase family)
MSEIHGVYPPHADPAVRPLEHYTDQAMPMKPGLRLGLFLPNESWAEFPTLAPTTTEWTYAYNRDAALLAEEAGFSFVLPAGRWKGLQGDDLNWRGSSLDTITLSAALLEATSRITVLTTIHTNVFNPVVAAKFGADMDQIGQGRWGMNIVSGWGVHEFAPMGIELLDHKERYAYTAEWLDIVRGLWEHGVFSYDGKHFTITEATAWPRPAQGPRPLLVNAGQSYTGMKFSVEQVDYAFTFPANRAKLSQICAEVGRDVGFIGTKRVLLGRTDEEAAALATDICAKADKAALRAHYIAAGAATEETIGELLKTQADYDKYFLGDALVGSPETVAAQLAEWAVEYKPNAVTLLFYNCIEDLGTFAEQVIPLLAKRLDEADFPLVLESGLNDVYSTSTPSPR